MTEEEKLAEEFVNREYDNTYYPDSNLGARIDAKQAYLAGFKAGKDMAEADLATVAYMQGAERQKKKAVTQLTKAKKILKSFLSFVNNKIEYDPEHPQEHTDLWNELCEQAEQFLKEVSE